MATMSASSIGLPFLAFFTVPFRVSQFWLDVDAQDNKDINITDSVSWPSSLIEFFVYFFMFKMINIVVELELKGYFT